MNKLREGRAPRICLDGVWQDIPEGMTLRDYFAGQVLAALDDFTRPELMAGRAYAIADAMLVEREKQ